MTVRRILLPISMAITLALLALNYFGSPGTEEPLSSNREADSGHESRAAGTDILEAVPDSGDNDSAYPSGISTARQAPTDQTSENNPDAAESDSGVPEAVRHAGAQTPASERSAPVLSPRVFYVIEEAQRRQMADQWAEALTELNALYTDFDSLSPFEQATLLNFYTNTLIRLEMWQESISAFTLLLTVDNLRADSNSRALLALGQLHQRVDELDVAAAYYEEWLDFTRGMPGLEAQTTRVEQMLNNLR